jgi:hypothetical protein
MTSTKMPLWQIRNQFNNSMRECLAMLKARGVQPIERGQDAYSDVYAVDEALPALRAAGAQEKAPLPSYKKIHAVPPGFGPGPKNQGVH